MVNTMPVPGAGDENSKHDCIARDRNRIFHGKLDIEQNQAL